MLLSNILPLLSSLLPFSLDFDEGHSLLPEKYHQPAFGQPRWLIREHTLQSMHSLILSTNHSSGQFYDGLRNLPGSRFFWQSQNGWTAIIFQDRMHQTRNFFREVVQSQEALARWPGANLTPWGVPLVNTYNDDAEWAALANLEAYEAYGRKHFLDRAIGVWDFVQTYAFVTPKVIKDGYFKGVKDPSNTIMKTCNGKSLLGGVYWVNGGPEPSDDFDITFGRNNAAIGSVSTGLHALTGAVICANTGDLEYCKQAYKAVDWLDRLMVAPNGLLYDNLKATDCTYGEHQWTYNAGLYIASNAILGHVTSNSTSIENAERTAMASMSLPIWNTPQGVNNEGQGEADGSADPIGFKSILVRYLHKACPYLSKDVQASIRHYVNIQYWAMVNLASDDPYAPIRYSRNWTGPAFNLSTEHSQVAALDVLNALELNPDSAFPVRRVITRKVIEL